MTKEARAILGRFNGNADDAEDYCRRVIAEYQGVIDAVRTARNQKIAASFPLLLAASNGA